MESRPGTYALILKNRSKVTAQIGRWRRVTLEVGYYAYIGSAFGPGGVKARVSRHLRKEKRRHWHIDYLREFMRPVGVWYTHENQRLEHEWARWLSDMSGMSSIEKFGCSDCSCHSHLFFASGKSALAGISSIDGREMEWLSFRHVSRPKAGPPAPWRAPRHRTPGR
jgi:Uri superfamily endonuclease